ncbi:hypothetical protein DENSPDRAFT_853990 [Dentipellis sp. KUC8613]|nr:hypothetical protein DENSPDRAFT_853990 [Dentipellis sp. KUC8613]
MPAATDNVDTPLEDRRISVATIEAILSPKLATWKDGDSPKRNLLVKDCVRQIRTRDGSYWDPWEEGMGVLIKKITNWFRNHSRERPSAPKMSLLRRPDWRVVLGETRKQELYQLLEDEYDIKVGDPGWIKFYQKAITLFGERNPEVKMECMEEAKTWKKAIPDEIKKSRAQDNARRLCHAFAAAMHDNLGVELFMRIGFVDADDEVVGAVIDKAGEFNGCQSFRKAYPAAENCGTILTRGRIEAKNAAEGLRKQEPDVIFEYDTTGWPIMPNLQTLLNSQLLTRKKFLRKFVQAHYAAILDIAREGEGVAVPWNEVWQPDSAFFDVDIYLPNDYDWSDNKADPAKIKTAHLEKIFRHWDARQASGLRTFQFKNVRLNSKGGTGELRPAWDKPLESSSAIAQTSRQRGRRAGAGRANQQARGRRGGNARGQSAVARTQTNESDEEEVQVPHGAEEDIPDIDEDDLRDIDAEFDEDPDKQDEEEEDDNGGMEGHNDEEHYDELERLLGGTASLYSSPSQPRLPCDVPASSDARLKFLSGFCGGDEVFDSLLAAFSSLKAIPGTRAPGGFKLPSEWAEEFAGWAYDEQYLPPSFHTRARLSEINDWLSEDPWVNPKTGGLRDKTSLEQLLLFLAYMIHDANAKWAALEDDEEAGGIGLLPYIVGSDVEEDEVEQHIHPAIVRFTSRIVRNDHHTSLGSSSTAPSLPSAGVGRNASSPGNLSLMPAATREAQPSHTFLPPIPAGIPAEQTFNASGRSISAVSGPSMSFPTGDSGHQNMDFAGYQLVNGGGPYLRTPQPWQASQFQASQFPGLGVQPQLELQALHAPSSYQGLPESSQIHGSMAYLRPGPSQYQGSPVFDQNTPVLPHTQDGGDQMDPIQWILSHPSFMSSQNPGAANASQRTDTVQPPLPQRESLTHRPNLPTIPESQSASSSAAAVESVLDGRPQFSQTSEKNSPGQQDKSTPNVDPAGTAGTTQLRQDRGSRQGVSGTSRLGQKQRAGTSSGRGEATPRSSQNQAPQKPAANQKKSAAAIGEIYRL